VFIAERVQRCLVAVDHHHARACRQHRLATSQSDARCSPGHDGNLAFQFFRHLSSPCWGYHTTQYSNPKLSCWGKARPSVWRLSPSQAPCPGAPSLPLNRSYLVRNDWYLRIPAEDPRRFGSDSGNLVADPIGHQVRFSPLGVPDSLKSSEHNALLLVRHLIEEAHVGGDLLRWFAPAAIENCNRRSDLWRRRLTSAHPISG
jgi:hypothetical protein